jgi:hypothetical protein
MEQDDLLRVVVAALERLGIPYLVTGSIATIFYGEPRFTNDIDIVVALDQRSIGRLVESFSADDFYLAQEAAERAVARRSQFNLIHPRSGLKVDFMVAAMDAFDRSRFTRGRRIRPAADYEATFASPEDVVLKKLEYYRVGGSDKHLRDCAAVLRITPDLDRAYIASWAEKLGVDDVWQHVLSLVEL